MNSPHSASPRNFSTFDNRAKNGDALRVAFLGGSLTWGAGATDPMQTSYRALIQKNLLAAYPNAHFVFKDAAIGGSRSTLASFRLDRDVLSFRPDLVFLDFTINDDPYIDPVPSRLSGYESVVRRLIQANVPVLQAIFPVKVDAAVNPPARPLDAKHKAIGAAYGLPIADAVALYLERVASGQVTPDQLWDLQEDHTHPGDAGYALYADAVWLALEKAIAEKCECRLPEKMINADTFMTVNRWLLASAPALPEGWIRSKPHRIGCAFDFVCSRWMDELVIAGCTPLRVKIRAVDVLFFLETTQNSGSYQVRIDGGEPTCYSAKCRSGNMPLAEIIAIGLSPDCEHDLEITPVLAAGEEFRLESICVSGGAALISGPLL